MNIRGRWNPLDKMPDFSKDYYITKEGLLRKNVVLKIDIQNLNSEYKSRKLTYVVGIATLCDGHCEFDAPISNIEILGWRDCPKNLDDEEI